MVSPDDGIIDRILDLGAAALSEVELVAAIVGGKTGEPGHEKARLLLEACGGVRGLLTCNYDIVRAQQLDRRESAAVLASVELSRRLARFEISPDRLDEPFLVYRYLHLKYARIDQIVAGAVFLDVHNRLLGHAEFFRGTHLYSPVEPGPILREAIRLNTHGVLVFVVRPSGETTPTKEDLGFCGQMREACKVVGLEFFDYLILGGGERWVSLQRIKPWPTGEGR